LAPPPRPLRVGCSPARPRVDVPPIDDGPGR
jgi:hypothetical protein